MVLSVFITTAQSAVVFWDFIPEFFMLCPLEIIFYIPIFGTAKLFFLRRHKIWQKY